MKGVFEKAVGAPEVKKVLYEVASPAFVKTTIEAFQKEGGPSVVVGVKTIRNILKAQKFSASEQKIRLCLKQMKTEDRD